jgi:hypothetical protein
LRPEDSLIVILGVFALTSIFYHEKVNLLGTQFIVTLVMLWIVGLVSTVVGTLFGTATLLSLNPLQSGLLTILKEAELVALFVSVNLFVQREKIAERLLTVLCIGGIVLAVLRWLEVLVLQPGAIIPPKQFHYMGEIFAFSASLCAGRFWFGTRSGGYRYLWATGFVITTIGILISGEAGALIGAGFAMGILVSLALSKKILDFRQLFLTVPVLIIIAIISPIIFPTIVRVAFEQVYDLTGVLTGNPPRSARLRFQNWGLRIPKVLSQRPVLGFGQLAVPPAALDSAYLQRLYYTGLLGFVSYIYLLLTSFRIAISGAFQDETGFVAGYAGIVGVMIGSSSVKGMLHSTKTSTFFVMASALVCVLLYQDHIGNRNKPVGENNSADKQNL